MISVEEAYNEVLSKTIKLNTNSISISEASGRILAEDIHADQDFPPFNRVMMDGIALDHKLLEQSVIPVQGMQTAGSPQQDVPDGHCMEVMTGAILPRGTDVVVPYEEVNITGDQATISSPENYPPLKNIHLRGTDRKKGDLLIPRGRRVSPAEIAVLATVGKSTVSVMQLNAAIVSTGDELVDIDKVPHPYQVRKSNSHMLAALISQSGYQATLYHIEDDLETTTRKLGEILENHPVVILSGGVSRGKKDFVPDALDALGVNRLFHRVAQRPGKPFWFGERYSKNTVFALPGNPVSTFLCFHRYIKPWLKSCGGEKVTTHTAILGEDFHFAPSLTYFLQVRTVDDQGNRIAFPVAGKGSGDLANLLDADGFIEIPPGRDEFEKGQVFEYLPFR